MYLFFAGLFPVSKQVGYTFDGMTFRILGLGQQQKGVLRTLW